MRTLIILAALPWVISQRIREWVLFTFRKKLGDSKKKGQCCELLPYDFGIGRSLSDVPELAAKTEQICFTNTGYSWWYACRVCGQEWVQDHVGKGHSEVPQVHKAP
jgi:hypothetical protein